MMKVHDGVEGAYPGIVLVASSSCFPCVLLSVAPDVQHLENPGANKKLVNVLNKSL